MPQLPKILVYWPYERTDLLLPFKQLADQFEWHFVRYRYRDEDSIELAFTRHYWSDYQTPSAFIKALKPSAVLFFELSNLYSFALNIAAKRLQVPTCIQEHGIKLSFDYYASVIPTVKPSDVKTDSAMTLPGKAGSGKLHLLRYYASLFCMDTLSSWPLLLKYLVRVYRAKSDRVFPTLRFPLRKADYYLLISQQNFEYYQIRDGITETDVRYFGNPYLDDMFHISGQTSTATESYCLLIDDGNIEGFGITASEKADFFKRLNDHALATGHRLYIKLHPYDYGRTDLFTHPNIVYLETARMSEVIGNAIQTFAISSTLALPLIAENRVTLFRLPVNPIQELLGHFGVRFLPFRSFSSSEIEHFGPSIYEKDKLRFVQQFLFKNDGESVQRLAGILTQIIQRRPLQSR